MKHAFLSRFLVLSAAGMTAAAVAGTPATAAPAAAAATVQNDVFWKDTSGNPIYSQGGGVLKVGNTYYWYGAKYNGAVSYEGNALTGSDLGGGWVGRIGLPRNPNTGEYVLVSQLGGGLVFATSSTPNGKFTRAGTQSSISGVSTGMSGDQSVFIDDDGKA